MDLFATTALNRVIEELPAHSSFFLNAFFTSVETSDTETVMFDSVKGRRLVAPLVSPIVRGKVIREQGFKTGSLAPAYIKDKRVFDPSKQFKRRAGEKIGGTLSPEQRLAASIAFALSEQLEMWTRRLEMMAAETLRTGRLVLKGDEYPEVQIDFGRDPSLDIALTGSDKWNQAGVKPLDDIENTAQLVYDASGLAATDVIMGMDAWHALRTLLTDRNNGMWTLIDRNTNTIGEAKAALGPMVVDPKKSAVRLVGVFGDFRLWVHSDKYTDPLDGADKPFLLPNEVLLLSTGVEGVRHFGAIKDLKAGLQPRDYFVKSWDEEDPSVRFILGQSAPIVVPYHVNATARMTVL